MPTSWKDFKGGLFSRGGPKPLERRRSSGDPFSEDQHQIDVFLWADKTAALNDSEFSLDAKALRRMYHVKNGGSHAKKPIRTKGGGTKLVSFEALRFKLMGVRAGTPDICLPAARHGRSALYIEMKTRDRKREKNGGVSDKQRTAMEELRQLGNLCVVCYGAKEAIREIIDYLCLRKFHPFE